MKMFVNHLDRLPADIKSIIAGFSDCMMQKFYILIDGLLSY